MENETCELCLLQYGCNKELLKDHHCRHFKAIPDEFLRKEDVVVVFEALKGCELGDVVIDLIENIYPEVWLKNVETKK